MQFLKKLFRSWLFVAVGHALIEPQYFDNELFDPILDALPDDYQPTLAATNSLDQIFAPDWNLFSDDNLDLAQATELELLADDIACDASNVDSIQFFGKTRRGTSCQAEMPKGSNEQNLQSVLDARVAILFQEQPKVCPPEIFGLSNTPVCSNKETRAISEPGVLAATLIGVDPRMLVDELYLLTNLVASADQSAKHWEAQLIAVTQGIFGVVTRLKLR